jgi:hypothetical protein
MPTPSTFLPRDEARMRRMDSISSSTALFGSVGVAITSREVNLPLASERATVICDGRISTPTITRSSFRRRKVGLRPRGRRPVGPSITQDSAMSCSTIREMVLRCKPQRRERSAREMGCRVRIRFRTMRRLISRTTSLDAPCIRFGSITFIPAGIASVRCESVSVPQRQAEQNYEAGSKLARPRASLRSRLISGGD